MIEVCWCLVYCTHTHTHTPTQGHNYRFPIATLWAAALLTISSEHFATSCVRHQQKIEVFEFLDIKQHIP